MLYWMSKEKNIIFAAGAVAGVVLFNVLKAKPVRKLAVNALAKGMMLKDSVSEEVNNIREEADDLCSEAKTAAQCSCDGACETSEK